MARPLAPPPLLARQPTTLLGWSMRALRRTKGATVTETAHAFGCSASHVSRVERGSNPPSRALVNFYEQHFDGDGLLLSLFEAVDHADEQQRRRFGGRRPSLVRALAGDASTYIDDTIPDGTAMVPGQLFVKSWRVRNSGVVPWRGRRIERQGPQMGPGLITSPPDASVPDTDPGEIAEIWIGLRAPTYACSSIAYFKMIDTAGHLCFPDDYEIGLDVLVRVETRRSVLQLRQ